MEQNVLHVENVTMQFGGVVAVNNLSMDIYEHEIVALIGPNGAGKTTAFNCITGVYEPTNGKVEFYGEPIVESFPRGKMKKLYAGENADRYHQHIVSTPDAITKRGIARTFQNIRLFKSMTVFENVLTAMHMRRTSNVFSATFRLNREGGARAARPRALELLEIVGLDRTQGRTGDLAALRQAAPSRDRPRARDRAEAAAARRAGRRHEPAGDGRADRVHPRNRASSSA